MSVDERIRCGLRRGRRDVGARASTRRCATSAGGTRAGSSYAAAPPRCAAAAAVVTGVVLVAGRPARRRGRARPGRTARRPPTAERESPSFGVTPCSEGRWRTALRSTRTTCAALLDAAGERGSSPTSVALRAAGRRRSGWCGTVDLRAPRELRAGVRRRGRRCSTRSLSSSTADHVTMTPRFAEGATVHRFVDHRRRAAAHVRLDDRGCAGRRARRGVAATALRRLRVRPGLTSAHARVLPVHLDVAGRQPESGCRPRSPGAAAPPRSAVAAAAERRSSLAVRA